MNNFCSPKHDKFKYTCFSDDSLIKISTAYNTDMDKNIINIPIDNKLTDNTRKKLWEDIKKAMIDISCPNDYCLLKHNTIYKLRDDKINKQTFRPVMPSTWN